MFADEGDVVLDEVRRLVAGKAA